VAGLSLIFLSPKGALIALCVLVPLVVLVLVARRGSRLRAALAVPRASRWRLVVPTVAAALVAGLFGVAAAQPVAEQETALDVRTDAEAYVVIDISRSMLARSGVGGAMRLTRAKAAAVKLRSALPEIPVGVASLTDRVLPHLFPSADADTFRTTVALALGIERPPPRSSLITTATSLDSLAAVATQRFFSPRAQRRVVVVLTDGETQGINEARLARAWRRPPGVDVVFVHFWSRDERVFSRGLPEPQYRPDPGARNALDSLANVTGATVFDEDELDAATSRVRSLLKRGPTVTEGVRKTRLALAPYLLAAALLPLGVLLWKRER
jgi:von Willebrand factor type A domain